MLHELRYAARHDLTHVSMFMNKLTRLIKKKREKKKWELTCGKIPVVV